MTLPLLPSTVTILMRPPSNSSFTRKTTRPSLFTSSTLSTLPPWAERAMSAALDLSVRLSPCAYCTGLRICLGAAQVNPGSTATESRREVNRRFVLLIVM
jgi:hypothetical protein